MHNRKSSIIEFQIENSSLDDLNHIFHLYHLATEVQKKHFKIHWPEFERKMVQREIIEKHQWKLLVEQKIVGIWATTFSDPKIWNSENNDPSVYIHRIAANPEYKGLHIVPKIIDWAKCFANQHNKKFLRMDTVGLNPKLIKYYQDCGFEFLGTTKLLDTTGLPAHYQKDMVSPFQLKI